MVSANGSKKMLQAVTDCEKEFEAMFPDFFYEGSTALGVWTMGWNKALEVQEEKKPVIQLI